MTLQAHRPFGGRIADVGLCGGLLAPVIAERRVGFGGVRVLFPYRDRICSGLAIGADVVLRGLLFAMTIFSLGLTDERMPCGMCTGDEGRKREANCRA